jgi:hypothetical protein
LILIVTHSGDITADLVIRHLQDGDTPYIRLNSDFLGTESCFFGFRSEPELHIDSRIVRASEVTAVWARRFALPLSLNSVVREHVEFVRRELAATMDAFLETAASAFYINSQRADSIAGNRLLQSQYARAVGMNVPRALVTQDEMEARQFLEAHPHSVTKAISFGRVANENGRERVAHTSIVPEKIDLTGLKSCPALFEQMIAKKCDWRVTTVGSKMFSAKLPYEKNSPIDWRLGDDVSGKFQKAELPSSIEVLLDKLCKQSGIVFGAHDLIETDAGEFYFLETNPAGQWGWLELRSGLPIGRAIAQELMTCGAG